MAEIDLNILIGTIVTATAALVAILGGFLVSRVLTLSSEQNGIRRRIREIGKDILVKKDMLSRIENDILEEDVDDFIYENYEEILFKDKDFEEILSNEDFRGRKENEFKPYIDELKAVYDDFFLLLIKQNLFKTILMIL